jgi:hypothetical protein
MLPRSFARVLEASVLRAAPGQVVIVRAPL